MIKILEKKECCGCGACVSVCPQKCIEFTEDNEGFLYPKVDQKKCINCGLCEKSCPILNKKEINLESEKAYVVYAKDEQIRKKSSSGGIFSLLAEQILNEGGVVFGASFDQDFSVKHIPIFESSDLDLIRGSKYLQSRTENTYAQVKELLESGRIVLYSGVACQIAGLHSFLKKDYDNLYSVDVLCHGVPSPKLWKKYLKEQERNYGGNLKCATFRDKKYGWKHYSVLLTFENEKMYQRKQQEDDFMRLFLKNICLRPSCHDCKFKSLNRPSDITLGDCWGINKLMPEMDDDKGTSVVLIHSGNGEKLFENVKDSMIFKENEVDEILPKSADSRKSVLMHKNRTKFFKKLNRKDIRIKSLVKLIEPSICTRLKNKTISLLVSAKHRLFG